MSLVDANLLLYAYNSADPRSPRARPWWERQLSGTEPVHLCWQVISAFIRIGTNPRVFPRPMTLEQAVQRIDSWLGAPPVRVIAPTDAHWQIYSDLLLSANAVANLVSDAHLAALAVEHGIGLFTTDADFARFQGLRWENPLA